MWEIIIECMSCVRFRNKGTEKIMLFYVLRFYVWFNVTTAVHLSKNKQTMSQEQTKDLKLRKQK